MPPPLSQIDAYQLEHLIRILRDDSLPLEPLDLTYQDYRLTHPGGSGPKALQQFTWSRGVTSEPLGLKLANWKTQKGKEVPYSYLTITYQQGTELVGFSLGQQLADAQYLYPSFRCGNGEGGKNRWFGRLAKDARSEAAMQQLAIAVREAWAAAGGQFVTHPSLPGDWVCFQPIPLAELTAAEDEQQWAKVRNLYIRELLRAALIAEKLRDESIATAKKHLSAIKSMHPLNQILYGPPGTGKTYSTAEWALAMLENRPVTDIRQQYRYQHRELRQELERYREREQLQFVTFHQSFSYEDFVEGIKPKLTGEQLAYRVEPGVFQRLARVAKQAWQRPGQLLAAAAGADFDTVYAAYLAQLKVQLQAGPLLIRTMTGAKAQITGLKNGEAVLVQHVGSTYTSTIGKKWTADVAALYDRAEDIVPMNQKMLEIGGPNASLQWALFRHFKAFEQQQFPAEQNPDAAALSPLPAADGHARFVLIIDEVNRGNVASIFGELITLLEEDKRAGQPDEQVVQLPYSKGLFSVPPNLHLLGTMNTADRSVEALDAALRRRFTFVEMPPRPELLSPPNMVARLWWQYRDVNWQNKDYRAAELPLFELLGCPLQLAEEQDPLWHAIKEGKDPQQVLKPVAFMGVDLQHLLEAVNRRLEYLLGRDYRLGHAWLMAVGSLPQLRQAFRTKLIPQLQEYFYGNWGRLRQILGPDFVVKSPDEDSPLLTLEDEEEGEGQPRYHISEQEWTIKQFRDIYLPKP